jgi:succinate-acetate transporter protein
MTEGNMVPTPGSHIADPAALGLAGFAMTTCLLSLANANILHESGEVFAVAVFYGGIAQLLAGLWEFAKGNTFGATAFCSYGAFWLSFWYLLNHTAASTLGGNSVAAYLFVWAIFTAYMTVAATKVSAVVLSVFVALTLTFIALGIGALAPGHITWTKIGGWLGLLTALLAWYGSFATVTNATYKRSVLPVGRLN